MSVIKVVKLKEVAALGYNSLKSRYPRYFACSGVLSPRMPSKYLYLVRPMLVKAAMSVGFVSRVL